MSNQIAIGVNFSPEVNLGRYLQEIKRYPVLSHEEEYKLAMRYKIYKDVKIATELITSHLRLVVKIVFQYKGYGLPLGDMIAEGNVGLLYAVNKFDPERGFRFSTYAMWWIKATVQKYILNSWSLVKIGTTTAQKKLFFNLRKIKNKLGLVDDKDFNKEAIEGIASKLQVSTKEVVDMNMRLKAHDSSLNVKISSAGEEGAEWGDFISDPKLNQEEVLARSQELKLRKKLFNQALSCLNEREKDILFKRKMCDKAVTLDELGQAYSISKERVRQIELNSVRKIRKEIFDRLKYSDGLKSA